MTRLAALTALALTLLLAAIPVGAPLPTSGIHAGPRHGARVTTPRGGKRFTRVHVVLAA